MEKETSIYLLYGREEDRGDVYKRQARERFISGEKYDRYDGIGGEQVVLHVAKINLLEVPSEGVCLTIDGRAMDVISCVDDMGMLSITLQVNTRE